ncbi:hypothetical protein E2C01_066219 [Portunus trituberculatus]|uniref:Secreted protein n=1 Tax=Portunus trituberculatus TaxID=210409 RepID=A0A5B7HRQ5_PORTR|nr:hypothetical protein [Portunus trituberculatus]
MNLAKGTAPFSPHFFLKLLLCLLTRLLILTRADHTHQHPTPTNYPYLLPRPAAPPPPRGMKWQGIML